MKPDIKFTIIITTRNRCDTLFYTIKTCLAIKYDNYEILISDNNSSDKTKEVVKSFKSNKIKYFNTSKSLSMTENWEFALSHVKNGFVTIIGDDDGFLPNSLQKANNLLQKTNLEALTWRKIEYCWPNHIYSPFKGYMEIPLFLDICEVSSNRSLQKIFKNEIGYNELPCIYNSFISMETINKALKLSKNNYLFDSTSPDVYSALIFALFTDKYLYSREPFSINGASKHSNGTAQRFKHIETKEADLFNKENKDSKRINSFFKYPQGLVSAEVLNAIVKLKENYPELLTDVKIDMKIFLASIAKEYSMRSRNSLFYEESVGELLAYAKKEDIQGSIEEILVASVGKDTNPKVHYGLTTRGTISFNSQILGVKNIYHAAIFSRYALSLIALLPSKTTLINIHRKLKIGQIKQKLSFLKNYRNYQKEFKIFKSTHGDRFKVENKDKYPCLNDKTTTTGFDKHYTYHTAWAARKLQEIMPKEHIDISSLTYFSTLVSAFIPVKFYDFRPAKIELDNLQCVGADITDLPFKDNSIDSLSCMHVVEHIGLGRYGDPLDIDGDLKAIHELKRVLSKDGVLLFVVPIGEAKIMFNAHRIYAYSQIIEYFSGFELLEFSLIPDQSKEGIIVNATKAESDKQVYGCGCFMFKGEN